MAVATMTRIPYSLLPLSLLPLPLILPRAHEIVGESAQKLVLCLG